MKLFVIVLLAALFAGTAALSAIFHNAALRTAISDAIPGTKPAWGKDDLLVLVVGLDYDYDKLDQETSAHSRSDIIMAIHLDFKGRHIHELSVPRDMVATLPGGQQAKINQAQSDGGIAESQTVVAQWLGVPAFDRYVVLRIDTLKDLVNAIGGIDVYVKTSDCLHYHTGCAQGRLDYDDSWGHLHVHLSEGMQHLDGDGAVGYARFRHDWCSDPCRIMRQQQVARAILQRLNADEANTLMHVTSLLAVINKDVQTNLTTQEELGIAWSLRSLTSWKIVTAQEPYTRNIELPGYGDSIVADDSAKRELVRTMLMPSGISQNALH